jgi:hypothetical protein
VYVSESNQISNFKIIASTQYGGLQL